MLNTALSDEDRQPLKCKNLIVMPINIDKAPGEIIWMPSVANQINVQGKFSSKAVFYRPFSISPQLYEFEGKHIYVDTAGGGVNGDETIAAVSYFLHGYIFIAELLKLPGGFGQDKYEALSNLSLKHRVNSIDVEKNFGFGAFAAAWRPVLAEVYRKAGLSGCPSIEDVWESGQKELRIIDTLEPIMARHRLIVNEDIIDYDVLTANRYPIDKRESYKFFNQLERITRDRNSLIHDDCADAVAGTVRKWVENIAVDEKVRMEQKTTNENVEFFESWGGNIGPNRNLGSMHNRFKRRQTKRRKR
jgi:hypothetical protein